jgi:protein-disulfide isomerase
VNWSSIRPWVGTVARLALGAIWIWAAWSKLADPRAFVQAVRAYDVTPEWLSKAIGYGMPVLELCIGVLLVLGIVTRAAAIVSGVLLIVFLIGVIQASARGLRIDCGCFGGGGQTIGSTHYIQEILRDLGLMVVSAYLVVWPTSRFSVDEFLARNDRVEMPSAKRMRTEQGKRKYNAMLEARRREAQIRNRYVTLAFALVVALVSVVGIGVQANRAKIQGDLTATNASVNNGVVAGKAGAPVTVDVFEDFQCPICLQFEQASAKDIAAKVKAGQIRARYHTMAFLDSASSGNRYSTRAANAALCASDVSVEAFTKYHDILYGKDSSGQQVQPKEGSHGRSNTQLLDYAKQAGIKGNDLTTFQSCMSGELHKALVSAITDNASQRGVTGTPTVMVNGKKLSTLTKASFDAAVATAAANAQTSSSPSPTGSTSSPASSTPSP